MIWRIGYLIFISACLFTCTSSQNLWQDPLTNLSSGLAVTWQLSEVSESPVLFLNVPQGKQHIHIRTGPSTGLKGRTTILNEDVEINSDTTFTLNIPVSDAEIQVIEMQVFSHAKRNYYRDRYFFEPALLPHSGQWFNERLRPYIQPYVVAGDSLYWQSGTSAEPWQLFYCLPQKRPALPPHVVEPVTVELDDNCSVLQTFSESPQVFQFRSPGSYQARSVHGVQKWMYVSSDPDFPKLTTPASLIEVTRYIARDTEFTHLKNAPNQKEALDSFWLQRGDVPDRARTLIAQYYGRAETANQLFTDGKPGWMTDRGMAYIVFGPPELAMSNYRKITWSYPKFRDLTLEFYLENGQWHLDRNREHQLSWNMAVHAWRQGRVP